MLFGDKSVSSDGCKAEALNTYFGPVSNPKVNFEIVQPDCKILLDDSNFTVSDAELLHYTQLLYNLLHTNMPCVTVYFDIMKAFNPVPHGRLIEKFTVFGFDEKFLLLFKSYLYGCTQSVKVNSTISGPVAITSVGPQGSVLGQLFFVLFFNDIIDSIHNSDLL